MPLLALHRIKPSDQYLKKLSDEIDHPNMIVGMYAMNAIEQTQTGAARLERRT